MALDAPVILAREQPRLRSTRQTQCLFDLVVSQRHILAFNDSTSPKDLHEFSRCLVIEQGSIHLKHPIQAVRKVRNRERLHRALQLQRCTVFDLSIR